VSQQLYFDDSDGEGPARETSHPKYVRVCEEELFYDCTDDLGPFGNDEGADTLFGLEDWFRAGANGSIRAFLDLALRKQSAAIPDLAASDRTTTTTWLEDSALAQRLASANRVVLAVAFGQLKISGKLDDTLVQLAHAALNRQQIALDHYLQRNPTWEPAAQVNAAIASMRGALEKLKKRLIS
jgi:uncharacterized protein YfeS